MEPINITLNAQLTTFVAGAYSLDFIGRRIAPLIPVRIISGVAFSFWKVNPAEYLRPRTTKVSRRQTLPVADFNWTSVETKLDDHSEQIIHPNDVVQLSAAQPAQVLQVPLNVRMSKLAMQNATFWFSHELEVRDLVFTATAYGANTAAAAAKEKFDDAESAPLAKVQTMLDTPLQPPNTLVFGLDVWRPFQRHPKVLSAIKAVLGNKAALQGRVTGEEIAQYFGIKEVIVGAQRINTAAAGQDAAYARAWGKHLAAIRVEDPPASSDVPYGGFCGTFHGTLMGSGPVWVTSSEIKPGEQDGGPYGAIRDVASHTRKVACTNADAGYLLTNVVS
ncbi:MAG: hypothetical protein WA117_20980 [Verrucomicrobiia bacterium]